MNCIHDLHPALDIQRKYQPSQWARVIHQAELDEANKQYLRNEYRRWRDNQRMSHRNDPDTSRQAAAKVMADGSRERHIQAISAAVRANPGQTNGELSINTNIDYHEVARRAPEAAERGLIHRGEVGGEPIKRKCNVRGTAMTTWLPGPKPKAITESQKSCLEGI